MNLRSTGSILLYGLCLGATMALLSWSRYRFTVIDAHLELYGLVLAVVFAALGAWLGVRLMKPKTVIEREIVIREVEVPVPVRSGPAPPAAAPDALGISQREHDVLRQLARGLSNEEIAAELFVSANTVKTHLSNLYFKLGVKRRTQAVEKARQLGLLT